MERKNLANTILVIALIIAVMALLYFLLLKQDGADNQQPVVQVYSFEECLAAGFPVMESYPRQCSANGKNFVEYIGNELAKGDLIMIENPRPNQTISSPLTIRGRARGTWYFEATFPVELLDFDGNKLVQSYATAQGDWMTNDFVPFSAVLNFTPPTGIKAGTLILRKSNPSDLPENDDFLELPIKFE